MRRATRDAPGSPGPVRPWPLYALVFVLALSAAGLVIGVVLAVPHGGGTRAASHAGAIERALGIGGADTATPASVASGPVSSRVIWTTTAQTRLRTADRLRGAFVATSCAACHGPDGVGGTELAPSLAGQDAGVLWKQLEDFRSGAREWSVMNAVAMTLSDSDIVAVAAYLSTVEPSAAKCTASSSPRPDLVALGDTRRLIPPCAACHEQENLDKVSMLAPKLAVQRSDYLARQLGLFRAGWRSNDVYGQMRRVAQHLTVAEIDTLARWYGGADGGLACKDSLH